jgi:hypothetical protein
MIHIRIEHIVTVDFREDVNEAQFDMVNGDTLIYKEVPLEAIKAIQEALKNWGKSDYKWIIL